MSKYQTQEERLVRINELAQKCSNAIIAQNLETVSASLHFEPNAFYENLDLLNAEAPGDGVDVPLILLCVGIVLAVGTTTTAVILLIIRRKKRAKLLAKQIITRRETKNKI